jgi:putative transposase
MVRLARIVAPGLPHHVTQRGNRRLETFFSEADYQAYLGLLAESCAKAATEVWAYCLMPNHVHLILVPSHPDGLRAALGEAHRRYTRRINRRQDWSGHLWQERFHSFPLDQPHLAAAVRYVERNPVRAGLAKRPEDWVWSSARAHLDGRDDGLVRVGPLLERYPDWRDYLSDEVDTAALKALRQHGRSGRPLGSERFVARLETELGRLIGSGRRGRPPKT